MDQDPKQDVEQVIEHWEAWEEAYDPDYIAELRRERRTRAGPRHRAPQDPFAQLAEPEGLEAGFRPTYHASRFESVWLPRSLSLFYEQGLIIDVLALIKGGKEANVYRCAAHPATGLAFVAAKVYRPRMFRNLRNDALYRQGREVLTEGGQVVKKTDHRVMRAIGKKTTFGLQVSQTSWLAHEYVTLSRLFEAGCDVPRPLGAAENAVLMAYCGAAQRAAPPLHAMTLPLAEAERVFQRVVQNLSRMLSLGLVHGDLSAFNILYWEGAIALIDWPQVVDLHANHQARAILARDVARTCSYFQRQGVACDAEQLTEELWRRHGNEDELRYEREAARAAAEHGFGESSEGC